MSRWMLRNAGLFILRARDVAQNDTMSSVSDESRERMMDEIRPATLAAMFSPSPDNVCSIAHEAVAQAMEEPA